MQGRSQFKERDPETTRKKRFYTYQADYFVIDHKTSLTVIHQCIHLQLKFALNFYLIDRIPEMYWTNNSINQVVAFVGSLCLTIFNYTHFKKFKRMK